MRTCTTVLVFALLFPAGAAVAAGQEALGGYNVTMTPDNRLRYTLNAPDFSFTRITAVDRRETELTIASPTDAAVVIRFGGGDIAVERGGQTVTIQRGDPNERLDAAAALLNGRAVVAFRRAVGKYERELMNDPAALSANAAPFAYSLLLTSAFVSQLAGDPNAVERTRDLIRRQLGARVREAAWLKKDCVTDYEQALMANDTRMTQCIESAQNIDSTWLRLAEEALCSAEFIAGALGAETKFISCCGLALKIQ